MRMRYDRGGEIVKRVNNKDSQEVSAHDKLYVPR